MDAEFGAVGGGSGFGRLVFGAAGPEVDIDAGWYHSHRMSYGYELNMAGQLNGLRSTNGCEYG